MNPSAPRPSFGPFVATRRPLSRRHFLRGAGVALALPWLEAMMPRFARGQSAPADAKPRRMFAVINNLGFIPTNFFPTGAGREYTPSPYLELLAAHRRDFTVFTGVSLPNVDGGHPADIAWLTGAAHPGRATFRNTISVDQMVAKHIGHLTRFGSMTLAVNTRSRSLSVTEDGKTVPPEDRPSQVFRQLFVAGSNTEAAAQIRELETGRSILDAIGAQAQAMDRSLGRNDQERLDQYYTSVRDLEHRLAQAQHWAQAPKPVVAMREPIDPPSPSRYFEKVQLMYDLATIAFQTDSSRAITLFLDGVATPRIESPLEVPITEPYMRLAYHEDVPERLLQFQAIDREHFRRLGALLGGLKAIGENGETLLDRTQVLWGSNFNSANGNQPRPPIPVLSELVTIYRPTGEITSVAIPVPRAATAAPAGFAITRPVTRRHGVTTNLPIIFAGGGWKHGQHLVFDTEKNYPLTNLHLSMLHRMGILAEKFSSSTGEFAGLEMA
jgi:hypothetical protein